MKKILILLFSFVFILAACGDSNEASKNTSAAELDGKSTEEKMKLKVILAAEGTPMYYAYVAQEKGFFAEEGLDVELEPGKGSSYVIQKVGARTVNFAITASPPLFAAWDEEIDIRAIYQINVKNLFDVIVKPESGIKSIQDLRGKVIGVSDLGGGEVPVVKAILADAGLHAGEDVTLLPIGTETPSIIAAFEEGTIDAYSGGAHDLVTLYGQGFEVNSIVPEKFETFPSTAIIVNGRFLDKNQEVAVKFARAIAKATNYSINNYDEVYNIMKEKFPEQYADEKISNLFLQTFIGLSTPIEPEKGYGYIYEDSWKLALDQFKGDVIKNDVNLQDYVDSSLLEEINNF